MKFFIDENMVKESINRVNDFLHESKKRWISFSRNSASLTTIFQGGK
ncbi:MAG: hypothetical protein ACTSVY_04420 [Candidatus Helarchaeota archaeon]